MLGRISRSSSQLTESSRVARIASGDGAPATATVGRGGNARLNPERVLVCIDPAKPSPEVIVAGAQLAARVGAIWFAAAVDVSRSSSFMAGQRRPRLLSSDVIALIEMLGGEVIEVTARDPAAGLIGLAFREGFTHVVFGQRRAFSLPRLFKRSTCQQFATNVPGTPVYVVPIVTAERLPHFPFSASAHRALVVGAAVAAGVAAIALIAVMPALVALGIAVTIAIAWCIWLERNPTTQN